jgi:hypothetical protein
MQVLARGMGRRGQARYRQLWDGMCAPSARYARMYIRLHQDRELRPRLRRRRLAACRRSSSCNSSKTGTSRRTSQRAAALAVARPSGSRTPCRQRSLHDNRAAGQRSSSTGARCYEELAEARKCVRVCASRLVAHDGGVHTCKTELRSSHGGGIHPRAAAHAPFGIWMRIAFCPTYARPKSVARIRPGSSASPAAESRFLPLGKSAASMSAV